MPNNIQVVKEKYRIAGINTGIISRKDWIIERQARPYIAEFDGVPDIICGIDDKFLSEKSVDYPALNVKDCEYMFTGEQFCRQLLGFDGFMLHSSAVVYKDRAYLFSATSGTGKSTHTGIWQRVFGKENTYILNDDKPVIRMIDGQVYVFGTPWSGKTDQNRNVGVLLQGICFITRAEENHINKIDTKTAIYKILNQTIRPDGADKMTQLLDVLDRVLQKSAVYEMGCNMTDDAAITAFNGMNGIL